MILLVFMALLWPSWAFAATGSSAVDTFYVRPAADCANNGDGLAYACAASEGASGAFSVLTNVVWTTTTGVDDGDTLYICGPHTGYLTVGSSVAGTASAHIAVSFACPGDPGTIRNITNMTEALTGGNWTNESGNLWYLSVASYTWKDPKRIWTDSTERFPASAKAALGTSEGGPTAYYWYDSGNSRIYVYSTANPATAFSLFESLVAGNGTGEYAALAILNELNDYIDIIDPNLQGGNLRTLYILGGDNITVTGSADDDSACHIGAYARNGVFIGDTSTAGTGNPSSNVRVQDCTIDPLQPESFTGYTWQCCTGDGVDVVYGTSGVRVHSNTIRDWGHVNVQVAATLGTGVVSDVHVSSNTIECHVWVEYCRGVTSDGAAVGRATNIRFFANTIDGASVRSQLNGDHVTFAGNLITNQRQGTASPTAVQALDIEAYVTTVAEDITVVHNLFMNNLYGPCISVRGGTNTKVRLTIHNNILVNCGGTALVGFEQAAMVFENFADVGNTHSIKNNIIYDTAHTNTVYYKASGLTTVAAFQSACSGDVCSGNLASDPLLRSTTDFRLQLSSPAVRAGIVGVCRDVRDRSCPSTAPDIGAYQSTSGDPAATRAVRN